GRLAVLGRYHRPAVLQVDPVDLLAALEGRPGLQGARRGQLVSAGQDRVGQRAGFRWPLRAGWDSVRATVLRPMCLRDLAHVRAAAQESRLDRLVGVDEDRSAELDWEIERGRSHLRSWYHSFHNTSRHDLRRDVPGDRPGASAGSYTAHVRSSGRGRL